MWDEIEIMRKLRTPGLLKLEPLDSFDHERHPNVCRLFETFESETQAPFAFFFMFDMYN